MTRALVVIALALGVATYTKWVEHNAYAKCKFTFTEAPNPDPDKYEYCQYYGGTEAKVCKKRGS